MSGVCYKAIESNQKHANMNKRRTTTLLQKTCLLLIAAGIGVVALCQTTGARDTAQTVKDDWAIHKSLVLRLSSEWQRIGLIAGDLSALQDILTDVKDIELLPLEVTNLSEARIVEFDKRIERAQRECVAIQKELESLRSPLTDAIGMLRELVVGKPVEDMFVLIE